MTKQTKPQTEPEPKKAQLFNNHDILPLNKIFKSLILFTASTLIFSCSPENQTPGNIFANTKEELSARVIYGSDGRLDLYQVSDERLLRLAKSTAALIKNSDLTPSGSDFIIAGVNYGTSRNLCSSEKFREQETGAFCSGFLVRPDIMITAGHCITNAIDCSGTSFVFDYGLFQAGVLPKKATSTNIYRCAEVLKTQNPSAAADYAVIRLNKAVVGREPLAMRQVASDGQIQVGEVLVVIGHPVGLPTKVTTGGKVRSVANREFLVASVDTYGGNSGSAVFNARTGLIEGILVRGEADFTSQGSCTISKVCTEDGCRGEDITRIAMAQPFIPAGYTDPNDPPHPPPPVDQPESFRLTVGKAIPDNNQKGISSSLVVGSDSRARNISVYVNIKHPFIGDLLVQIVAPDGKIATLHQRAGGSADDINKSYEVTASVKAQAAGTYRLVVNDLARQDVGKLVSWGVDFQ